MTAVAYPRWKQGIAHSDPKTKATILNEQFSNVFTEETSVYMPAISGSMFADIHSFKVDQAGVLKLMQGLNPHKAEGPDHNPIPEGVCCRTLTSDDFDIPGFSAARRST